MSENQNFKKENNMALVINLGHFASSGYTQDALAQLAGVSAHYPKARRGGSIV